MNVMKKILNISIKVITWLTVAFAAFMMIFTVVTVTTVDKNERSIFGFKFYIVTSNSMSPSENNKDMDVHFSANDIIIAKTLKDNTTVQPGDIISFISSNSVNFGETVTHMVDSVKYNEDGSVLGYVTFGTNTGAIDEALVQPDYVLGQYAGKIPQLGRFFLFVKSTEGYVTCILVPFLLLILYNLINVIVLFRRYKKEQNELIEAEKAEIAAERKQNEDMLKELLALKEQLAKQASAEPQAPPAAEAVEKVEPSEPAEVKEEMTETVETPEAAETIDNNPET